ncbi:MAG TPA: hypothetical protein PK950_00355 [Candidatus Paceibacterota bacterium]|nr:hypothetical protein [Candidatus Paceibacterota bacterium]
MEGILTMFGEIFGPLWSWLKTFLGYFFRGLLLVLLAIVYLPAFLITTFLNDTFESMLKEFGF